MLRLNKRVLSWVFSILLCIQSMGVPVYAEEESQEVPADETSEEVIEEVSSEDVSETVLTEEEEPSEELEEDPSAETEQEEDPEPAGQIESAEGSVSEESEDAETITDSENAEGILPDIPEDETDMGMGFADGSAFIYQEGGRPAPEDEQAAQAFADTPVVDLDVIGDELSARFAEAAGNWASTVNVYDLQIPSDKENGGTAYFYAVNDHPELFYVDKSVSWTIRNDYVYEYRIEYKSEYNKDHVELFNAAVNDILSSLDSNWPDHLKALYIHDELVLRNTYDTSKVKHDAYNALVEHTSVCEGYALAYKYLLRQVGIECDLITAESFNHAWNVVYVDGTPYFTDCTWDDPVASFQMYCGHQNFLRSRDGMLETGHVKNADGTSEDLMDWVDTKGKNAYDNLVPEDYPISYWRNSLSRAAHLNTLWAYTKGDHSGIYVYDYSSGNSGTERQLAVLPGNEWEAVGSETGYYGKDYTSLDVYDGRFVASDQDSVYLIGTDGTIDKVGTLTEEEKSQGRIYGIQTEGYKVRYDLYTKALQGVFISSQYFDLIDEADMIHVAQLSLNNYECTMTPGSTNQLTVYVTPDNATDQRVTWTSSDPSVASVDSSGNVVGITPGTAVIRVESVSDPDVYAENHVTVKAEAESVDLSDSEITLTEGSTYQLTARVLPEDCLMPELSWTSDHADTAAVDNNGLITALSEGTAVITVSFHNGSKYAQCTVNVRKQAVSPESVAIISSAEDFTVEKGNSLTLTAQVEPENAEYDALIWNSSDPEIALVSIDGTVTGISAGTAVVSVTVSSGENQITGQCEITVTENEHTVISVTGVSVYPASLDLNVNEVQKLEAVVMPGNADNQNVTWSSDNTAVAAVDADGTVHAVSAGTAVITVTTEEGGYQAVCNVNVNGETETGRSFTGTDRQLAFTVKKPYTTPYAYTVNGDPGDLSELKLISTDNNTDLSDILVLSRNENGEIVLTGRKVGQYHFGIYYEDTLLASTEVDVFGPDYSDIIVENEYASSDVIRGLNQQLQIEVYYDYAGVEGDYSELTYTSSDESVFKVIPSDDKRFVTIESVGYGRAAIEVHADWDYEGDSIGYIYITVKEEIPQQGEFLEIGESYIYDPDTSILLFDWLGYENIHLVYYIDGKMITDQAGSRNLSVRSTNEDIVKVSAVDRSRNFKVTAVHYGEADIIVSGMSGDLKTLHVKVVQPDADDINLLFDPLMIAKGETAQIVYTFWPENAKPALSASYSSDNTAIASVDENGVVTGVAEGSANIEVTLQMPNGDTLNAYQYVTVGESDRVIQAVNSGNNHITMTFPSELRSDEDYVELKLYHKSTGEVYYVYPYRFQVNGKQLSLTSTNFKYGMYRYVGGLPAGEYKASVYVGGLGSYQINSLILDETIYNGAPEHMNVETKEDGVVLSCADGDDACYSYLESLYENQWTEEAEYFDDQSYTYIAFTNETTDEYGNMISTATGGFPVESIALMRIFEPTIENDRVKSLKIPASVFETYGIYDDAFTLQIKGNVGIIEDSIYTTPEKIQIPSSISKDALIPRNLHWTEAGDLQFYVPVGTAYEIQLTCRQNGEVTYTRGVAVDSISVVERFSTVLKDGYTYSVRVYTAASLEDLRKSAIRYEMPGLNYSCWKTVDQPLNLRWYDSGSFEWDAVGGATEYHVVLYRNGDQYDHFWTSDTFCSEYEDMIANEPDADWQFSVQAIGELNVSYNSDPVSSLSYPENEASVKAPDIPVAITLDGKTREDDTHILVRRSDRTTEKGYVVNAAKTVIEGPSFTEAGEYTYLVYLAHDNLSVVPVYDTYKLTYTVTGESDDLKVSDPVMINEQGETVSTVAYDLETTKPASFTPEADILLNGSALPDEYDGKFTFLLKDDEGIVLQTVHNNGSHIAFDSLSGLNDQVKYYYTIVAQNTDGFVAENEAFHLVLDLNDVKDGAFVPEVTYESANYNKVDSITFNLIAADYTVVSDPLEVQVLKDSRPAEELSFIRREDISGKEDPVTVITKNGTAELPAITFTSAGEYRYSVYMTEDNTAVVRDKAVYEINYKVEETAGALQITEASVYDEDGHDASSVVFRIRDKQPVTVQPYAAILIDEQEPQDGSVVVVLKDDEGIILQTRTNTGRLVTFDALEFKDIGRYYYSIEQQEGSFTPSQGNVYKFNVYVSATETGFETESFYLIPSGNSYLTADEPVFHNDSIALEKIALTEKTAVMSKGEEKQLAVEFTPDNATYRDLKWESDHENIAAVDENGLVKAVGNGKAVITVSANDGVLQDTCEITVHSELKGISFEKETLSLEKDGEYLLKVIYDPEDTTDDKTVTWKSSDESVVTVDEEGKLTGTGLGTATVTATTADGRYSAECEVTVSVFAESMKLSVNEEEILHAGETLDVDVTFTPEEAYEKLYWTSSDESVATVDENGVVTALKSGETIISAANEDSSLKESFTLIVAVDVTDITLDQTEVTLYINGEEKESVQLVETIAPENATIRDVRWTSSDESTVTVNDDGLVTAVNGGTAVITATTEDGEHTAECTVTVIVSVTGVSIYEINEAGEEEAVTAADLYVGEERKFTAKVLPENATNHKIIWESSDPEVAETDEEGNVKALQAGETVISATAEDGDTFAEVRLNIYEIEAESIEAEEEHIILPIGTEKKIGYKVLPENATNKTAAFESEDEEIVSVSEEGVLKGISRGTVTVTITAEDGKISKEITVEAVPDGIYMSEIEREYEYTGTAIKPEVHVYDRGIELTSSDYTVTYSNNTNAGTATITIKMKGNYTGTVTETFEITPIDLTEDERITSDALTIQATGKTLSPVPSVYFNGTKLKKGTDFTIDYGEWGSKYERKEAGEWDIVLKGNGNYTGEYDFTVNVAERSTDIIPVTKLKITAKTAKYQKLTGENFKEDIIDSGIVTIKKGTELLKYKDDYEINEIPEDYRHTGTLKFTITGVNGYYGDRTISVKITGISINDKKVKIVDPEPYVYTGEYQEVHEGFHLTYDEKEMDPEDYEILEETYTNNLKVGTASVKIEGRNGFTGTRTVKYKITANKTSITESDVYVEETVPYAKGGAKAAVEIYDEDLELKLTEGTDYTLKYANNKKVGEQTAKVTVTFKGNFKGTPKIEKYYSITKKDIKETTPSAKDIVYTGKAGKYKSTPVITDTDGKTLKAGTDYEKAYVYELDHGDGTYTLLDGKSIVEADSVIRVTVTGKGNYTQETVSAEYRILKKGYDIGKAVFTIENQEYTGEAIEIDGEAFTKAVINKTESLVYGRDYEIVEGSYKNNVRKGTASVVLRGLYPYGGTKTVKFKIVQKPVEEYWQTLSPDGE